MNLIKLLRFITSHPLNKKNKANAIVRFVKWQINTKLNPFPIIYQFTDKSKLIIQKGMTGATQNLYCGLHEFSDMAFTLHFLRDGDSFADIGANIGSYTVLASAHTGAKTISFEPVPATFTHLVNNISINQIQKKVSVHNIALGSQDGTIKFTSSFDTMNHVAKEGDLNTIEVPVKTLDEMLMNEQMPALFKIDVEGFETEVMNGAAKSLQRDELKAIIIELNGMGSRYGYDERKIHETLINLNFKPFIYNPIERSLQLIDVFGTHNTIYIRDLDFVKQRLQTALPINILHQKI
jgi:FkbM family methyltransferase